MHPIIKQIFTATFMSLGIVLVLGGYTWVRHSAFDLYIFNKVLAGASGVLLGVVIVTGVLSRLYAFFDKMMLYRKWLGIAAFFCGYAHGIITLFFLPDRFPASRFHLGNIAFVFALISLVTLSVLFVYSFQAMIQSLNRHRWWALQNWGVRIAFVFGLGHAVLVKLPYWQRWLVGEETSQMGRLLPPLGLIISLWLCFVIVLRAAEFGGKRWSQNIIYWSFVVTIVLTSGLFVRGVLQSML